MVTAGNPVGRRVIIAITALRKLRLRHGPSGKAAKAGLYESGSVVLGLIPTTIVQRMETVTWWWEKSARWLAHVDIRTCRGDGRRIMKINRETDSLSNMLIDHLRTPTTSRSCPQIRSAMEFCETEDRFDGEHAKVTGNVPRGRYSLPRDFGVFAVKSIFSFRKLPSRFLFEDTNARL